MSELSEQLSDLSWKSYRMGQLQMARIMHRSLLSLIADLTEAIEDLEKNIEQENNE